MIITVLGAAAGGGVPQWNCNGAVSRAAWHGGAVVRRTQSSIAVRVGTPNPPIGGTGAAAPVSPSVVVNASPDLRQQILATRSLWPQQDGPLRASPIAAVALTNGDVDHVAGLLTLREAQPFTLYASDRIHAALAANPIFGVLSPDHVARQTLALDQDCVVRGPAGPIGITIRPFAVPGKVALYLERPDEAGFGTRVGDTIGLEIRADDTDRRAVYIPGCAAVDTALAHRLEGADLLMFDGTLYTDDEMVVQGLSQKTGRRMGHISMSGPEGSIAALSGIGIGRRVFVHMNTTNPALIEGSPERRAVEAAGWEIACDGMEIAL